MKKLLLLSLFGVTLSVSEAQNGFTTYTTSPAFTGSPILKESALLVDNAGNKWIGFTDLNTSTPNVGLVKHNGTTWTVYNTSSTPALPSTNISSLAKDNVGNIWIGTKGAGLVKYDGTNFTTYNTTNGLPSNTITCIETNGTQVYVGTRSGLSRFDGVNFTNYTVANGKVPSDTITSIKAETANVIWLGGLNRLVQFNINSSFTISSYVNKTISPTSGNINCIYIDGSNTKWLGTTTTGLLSYNGTSFTNANSIYEIYGSYIPTAVYDIAQGLNNGVALKMATNGGYASVGIIELAANAKVYQYFSSGYNTGDFIEKYGANLIISQNGIAYTSGTPKMYHTFDKTNYLSPLGVVNSDNFKTLEINNIKAGIANRSDMHWDIGGSGNALYQVPKGKWTSSNFASALWIGGFDNANQLHGGAQTYRQSGVDFWPGPLDTTTALTNTTVATNYDKIWKVSYTDINNYISNFNAGNVQNGSYIPSEDILTWPAKGTGNYSRNLAPFVDNNNNGIYDPLTGGDYPKIKGDQALYFIYNDNLGAHGSSSCTPMGIEVQAMAYAYGCPNVVSGKPELTYTTFYDYKIINRSSTNYHDVYVSMWSDVDLGYYGDDYIGSNVADNYGYTYNADNYDETAAGLIGYGTYMPAQGFAIVKGPTAIVNDGIDNNNDGIVDEPNEDCKLNKFTYFNNNMAGVPLSTADPITCFEYRNYITGFWRDSTAFTCGGNAYGGTTPTSWAYTGDVNTGISTATNSSCGSTNWTEITAGNFAGDRRLIMSSGPFLLNAGQMQEVEYAFVTSFDSSSTTGVNLLSVAKLKTDVQKVKNFYNLTNKPNCFLTLGITELLKQNDFMLYPNPAKSVLTIKSTLEGSATMDYDVIDVLGKTVIKNETTNLNFNINISDLNSGIYFLRLKINNSIVVKKFVKE
jgi:hypothetical protein